MVAAVVAATVAVGLPAQAIGVAPARVAPAAIQTRTASTDRSFVKAAYADFLGRAPTADELATNVTALGTGTSRGQFLHGLATSTAWVSAIVNQLYTDTLGRPGDAGGVTYWTNVIRSGSMSVAKVAANFYASAEYFNGIGGGTNASWITDLYTKILHRPADSGGVTYWVTRTVAAGRVDVALAFFQSSESAHARVNALYQKLLGRGPDAGGWDYWAGQVVATGDITLAVQLASSTEYYNRAQSRFPPGPACTPLSNTSGWASWTTAHFEGLKPTSQWVVHASANGADVVSPTSDAATSLAFVTGGGLGGTPEQAARQLFSMVGVSGLQLIAEDNAHVNGSYTEQTFDFSGVANIAQFTYYGGAISGLITMDVGSLGDWTFLEWSRQSSWTQQCPTLSAIRSHLFYTG